MVIVVNKASAYGSHNVLFLLELIFHVENEDNDILGSNSSTFEYLLRNILYIALSSNIYVLIYSRTLF